MITTLTISDINLIIFTIIVWSIFLYMFEDYLINALYLSRDQLFLTPSQIYKNTNTTKWLSWAIIILLRVLNPIYSICCFVLWLVYRKDK